ncbi:MAG: 6-carboxytetrahydropterin synthase QueD [Phycisphaera sp.]|nr:6-carboxytetrahydropterin synthase QueD [Phycisphaera sp.]
MRIQLRKTFDFQAAHWLPTFPEGHKCRRMHGHSFYADVVVEGEVDPDKGYLLDYGDISRAVEPVRSQLDHYLLNEVEGLTNPTAEMIAKWVYDRLKPALPLLVEVRIHETCTSEAVYRGQA